MENVNVVKHNLKVELLFINGKHSVRFKGSLLDRIKAMNLQMHTENLYNYRGNGDYYETAYSSWMSYKKLITNGRLNVCFLLEKFADNAEKDSDGFYVREINTIPAYEWDNASVSIKRGLQEFIKSFNNKILKINIDFTEIM
jgi:hypothetical protein